MSRRLGISLVLASSAFGLAGQVAQDAAAQLQQAFPTVQLYSEGGHLARVWATPFGFGESPEVTAQAFVQAYSSVFGVAADELLPGNGFNDLYTLPLMYDAATDTYKFTLVYYRQYRDGIPVYKADLRLLVRNDDGYPLVLAASSLRDVGDWRAAGQIPVPQEGAAHAAAAAFEPGLTRFSDAELVIWAGVDNQRVSPRVAITFVGEGMSPNNEPKKWRLVCDAATGQILHSENLILFTDVTGNVKEVATTGKKPDLCDPEFPVNMKYAKVSIVGGSTAYADANGNFTIPNGGSSQVTVQSFMAGQYFTVDNAAGAEETLSLNVTPPGPANFVHNALNTTEALRAQMNGYLHANVVRDWVLTYAPNYNIISTQTNFPVYVNRSDGYCPGNAWYDGGSLNFCSSSSSYPNTAYSSVVYHEYGHHIVECGGSGQDQYGEGLGDCCSVAILDDHWVGYGFFLDCNTGLRDAENTLQYPCNGEIHACAPLLSGCVWDTRQELIVTEPMNYQAILSSLLINSVPLHSGGTITPQITIDWLTLDDNDGDITNGTPHYAEIATGFGNHNMDAPPLQLLAFGFPNGRPDFVNPPGGTPIRVEVLPLTQEPQPGTGMFYYKIGSGSYTSVPMEVVSPNVYDAVFPAITCGSTISYYFSAQTTTGQTVLNPSDAPATAYATRSAYDIIVPFEDDMETDQGWTVGDTGDTATTGIWTRNIPQATPAQPGADHTPDPGVMCWVTDYRAGNSIGDYDVDGGKTTLKTPIFDLSAYSDATISYWRWYSNDEGAAPNADTFRVDISSNGGSTWTNAETVGPSGPETSGGWYYHQFNVTDFVPMTTQIGLRFIAEDAGSGSIIEAAVDDFRIDTVDCTPPAFPVGDLNCDGTVGFADINPFVQALADPAGYEAAYPNCDINLGDVNGDGSVDFADINPFVALLTG
jgi:hypothetical protein